MDYSCQIVGKFSKVLSNFDEVKKAVSKGSRHMADMRVGSLSTDRWVETRLGAKYHDKLPPSKQASY
mgnify:CR=1 FL=1